jgi:hypothetical protein
MAFEFWKARQAKNTPSLAKRTRSFMKDQVRKLKDLTKRTTMKAFGSSRVAYPEIGKMYFYGYDPKYKDTLPYYDRLPLVIPIDFYDNGWLGMNLHYLPPKARYIFLKELMRITGNTKLTGDTKMQLSYRMLKGLATTKLFKPTIHRYLHTHVVTPITVIAPEDWEAVVFLPTAQWTKGKPY